MADTPLSDPARKALEQLGRDTRAEPSSQQLEAIWQRASAPSRPAYRLVVVVAAALVLVAVAAWLRPRREINAAPGAVWSRDRDRVSLTEGSVLLRTGDPLSVTTPQLTAVVSHAAALFDVTPRATAILVESGEVQWRAGTRRGRVGARQQILVAAEEPKLPLAASPGCSGDDAKRCEEEARRGSGLAAQSALYGLALAAHEEGRSTDAAQLFREYGERFSTGAFAPEAAIGLMLELAAQGRSQDAAAAAQDFVRRFPADNRIEAVKLFAGPSHPHVQEE